MYTKHFSGIHNSDFASVFISSTLILQKCQGECMCVYVYTRVQEQKCMINVEMH